MSVFEKNIEIYKEKNDCKGVIIAVWSLRQSPGGYKAPIKRLTIAFKKNYIHDLRRYAST